MPHTVIVFEDPAFARFAPLTHTRPVFELLCGAMSLRERIERTLEVRARLFCREHLGPVTAEELGRKINTRGPRGSVLWVNGRLLDPAPLRRIDVGTHPVTYWNGDQLVAAALGHSDSADLVDALASNEGVLEHGMLPTAEERLLPITLIDYPWQLPLLNGQRIIDDASAIDLPRTPRSSLPGVHLEGHDILVAPGARIDAGAALDARNGPIIVGSGAHIVAHTRVEGPCVVGAGSQLLGGKLRAGTTIGPMCRIGGEVEESVFHGYSNKYHDGFIGHAYIGEWVNLGALTTNSDLKNTYGRVKVWNDGKFRDTGERKVGALIGDHAKTGIGTLLNTGTVVGVAANLFGGGLAASKFIPSFSWGKPPEMSLYNPERCVATMRTAMARRHRTLSEAYLELVDHLYVATESERAFAGLSMAD